MRRELLLLGLSLARSALGMGVWCGVVVVLRYAFHEGRSFEKNIPSRLSVFEEESSNIAVLSVIFFSYFFLALRRV